MTDNSICVNMYIFVSL